VPWVRNGMRSALAPGDMMPASADVAELTIGIVPVSEAIRIATMVAPATADIELATFVLSIRANDLAN